MLPEFLLSFTLQTYIPGWKNPLWRLIPGILIGALFGWIIGRISRTRDNKPDEKIGIGATDVDLLAALKFLSETHRRIHEARIGREFKAVVSVLGLFAVLVAFLRNKALSNNPVLSVVAIAAITAVTIALLFYFWSSACSNQFNQRLAERAENLIMDAIGRRALLLQRDRNPRRPSANRWILEFSIVAIAAAAAVFIIAFSATSCL